MATHDTHPAEIDRIRRMLHPATGRATITISNPRDQHATFRLKRGKPGSNWEGFLFADVPDETAEYGWRSVGKIDPEGRFVAYRGTGRALTYAIELVLAALACDDPNYLADTRGGPYAVQAADSCGMCGRRLTHPDSIPVGIGPECAAKSGAFHPGYTSNHIRRTA